MTTAQVRVLTSDFPQYDRAARLGTGTAIEFQLAQYPVIEGTEKVYVETTLQVSPTDYDIDYEVGLITFTAAPNAGDEIVVTYRHALLSDQQITDLISMEPVTKLAAALALDTIASSESLIQKKMQLLDVQTDGPAVAADLRKHAATLRAQAADEAAALDDGAFDIAEMVFNKPGRRERLIDEALRGQL